MSFEISKIVEDTFVKTVNEYECNSDLKRAALKHERRGTYILNLTAQVVKGKKLFTRETIEMATRDLTKIFIQNVIGLISTHQT